ncbi:hypothetical protein AB6A40_000848 [Gnathostoma spinigerum]|uniref:G-protein coupled receptors family 1 profile domain-containing protein n=1 Tax=Gnathostoma spinigerum TaxID=75299 RepID=A0ABD6E7J0_9BILA
MDNNGTIMVVPPIDEALSITTNMTSSGDFFHGRSLPETISIGFLLGMLILACIIGNLFVILAVLLERELRCRPQNYLIFSLAVADLLVGLIVTPIGALTTMRRSWRLGETVCDFWISVDVLVCTSSILHLVAIALDRYWSITDITYVQMRTNKRIFFMLAIIWATSFVISVAPIFGWKDEDFYNRVNIQFVCLISQRKSYQVFSTATAFYIPLIAIICIYYKIMRAAKRRFRRERDRKTVYRREGSTKTVLIKPKISGNMPSTASASEHVNTTVYLSKFNGKQGGIEVKKLESTPIIGDDERSAVECNGSSQSDKHDSAISASHPQKTECLLKFARLRRRGKESIEMKRERKAWRTLAIITGTFVACWTPFFLVSLYRPFCECRIPALIEIITNWLGYLNSAVNPIIYTVFSLDFRTAFKRILKRLFMLKRVR